MSSELSTDGTDTTRCSQAMMQELEHVLSLVGPAREEIAHLKEQLVKVQGLPSSTILEDIEDLKRQNEDIRQENMKLKQQLNERDIKESKYSEMSVELQKGQLKIRDLEVSVKSLKDNEVKMKAANIESKDAFIRVKHDLEKRLHAALKDVEESKRIRQQRELEFEAENRKHQQDIAKLSASLKREKIDQQNLKKDLSDTKSRLSKLMGDKLSENNPDIADLSDNNRPSKLAEKHQELYDNQWTDAYEITEKCFPEETEETRIKVLLQILMTVYRFCKEEHTQQDKDLLQATYRTDKEGFVFPVALKSQFKELKRHAATNVIGNITEKYLKDCDKATIAGGFNEKVKDFVHECMTLCWFMVSQEPPLTFHMKVRKGDAFDGSKYKMYTATGTDIDFVVWPALLLHKDGPVLSKGIVQCATVLQGSKSVKARSQEITASVMGVQTGSLYLTGNETPVDTTTWCTDSKSVHQQAFASHKQEKGLNSSTKQSKGPENQQTGVEHKAFSKNDTSQWNQHTSGNQQKNQRTTGITQQNPPPVRSYQENQHTVGENQQNQTTSGNTQQNPPSFHGYQENQHTAGKNEQPQTSSGFAQQNTHLVQGYQENQHIAGKNEQPQTTSGFAQQNPHSVQGYQENQHTAGKNQQHQTTSGFAQQNTHSVQGFQENQHTAGKNQQHQTTSGFAQQNPHSVQGYQENQHRAGKNQQHQTTSGFAQQNTHSVQGFQENQHTAGKNQQHQTTSGFAQQNTHSVQGFHENQHTAGKNQQHQTTSGFAQQNPHSVQGYQVNQHTAGKKQQKLATDGNDQQYQSAVGSYRDIQTNTNQTRLASQLNAGNEKQNAATYSQSAQAPTSTYQVVYQQQYVPSQYPAHLVPTHEEYTTFMWYNTYQNYYIGRYRMGAQIYDKCLKYYQWLQSNQYNVNGNSHGNV